MPVISVAGGAWNLIASLSTLAEIELADVAVPASALAAVSKAYVVSGGTTQVPSSRKYLVVVAPTRLGTKPSV